ncbi:MAG: peptidoglycan-binding protein [Myxococcaceae bacterium]|nr:peptidoglycan-binding protein [Myxococcaceae bacterium]
MAVSPVSSRLDRVGSQGAEVKELQSRLQAQGFDPGPVDGDYGPRTRAAVTAFQQAHGLEVDGVAGPKTWAALEAPQAAQTPPVVDPVPPPAPNAAQVPPVVDPVPAPAAAPISGPQPELSQGAKGPAVATLQRALAAAGVDPGPIDGDFGPMTASAVRRFQSAQGLAVDGIAGPQTWRALGGGSSLSRQSMPAPVALSVPTAPPANDAERRQRVLAIAQGEVGTREATGNNDGAVLKYPESFGRGSEAYCADFVSWVMNQSGGNLNQANCDALKADLVSRGQWKGKNAPQPGDIVLFSWNQDGGCDHVGLVKSVNANGTITTIEGNTDAGDGQGVWERTRTLDTIEGFGNPV